MRLLVLLCAFLVLVNVAAAQNSADCASNLYNCQQAENELSKQVNTLENDLETCGNMTKIQENDIQKLNQSVSSVKINCEKDENATLGQYEKVTEALLLQNEIDLNATKQSCQASFDQLENEYENLKKNLDNQMLLNKALENVQIEQEKEIFDVKASLSNITKKALMCKNLVKAWNISNSAFTISDDMLHDPTLFLNACLQNPISSTIMCLPSLLLSLVSLMCFYKCSKKTARKVKKKV